MKVIQLTQGAYTFVDDEDYERLWKMGKWCINNGYAFRTHDGKGLYMHRYLMNEPEGEVDHHDTNGLNNQKKNLRVGTTAQNQWNRLGQKGSASKYCGVWKNTNGRGKSWKAGIKVNGKEKHLGYFDDEIDAARAYNEASAKYHGEFAKLNDV